MARAATKRKQKKSWILRDAKEAKPDLKSVPPAKATLDDERQLTTHEAAAILQANASSIVKWINDGKLQAYRTPGGHRRVLVRDLREFVIRHNMFMPSELRS